MQCSWIILKFKYYQECMPISRMIILIVGAVAFSNYCLMDGLWTFFGNKKIWKSDKSSLVRRTRDGPWDISYPMRESSDRMTHSTVRVLEAWSRISSSVRRAYIEGATCGHPRHPSCFVHQPGESSSWSSRSDVW